MRDFLAEADRRLGAAWSQLSREKQLVAAKHLAIAALKRAGNIPPILATYMEVLEAGCDLGRDEIDDVRSEAERLDRVYLTHLDANAPADQVARESSLARAAAALLYALDRGTGVPLDESIYEAVHSIRDIDFVLRILAAALAGNSEA
jgi:hypothetical protein